ncbi:zinc-dependent alcohol dehydrogenase [Microbacterium yannicii]|uniref:zinc-dependent alcohol dehydrogenase n=1 Tax=Microbacterium yannicii TaxID=671622 RepID=UPI000A026627|nr:alcohol dehydrogenase catalytic domain-containing protein [Microbacterium yannicii]
MTASTVLPDTMRAAVYHGQHDIRFEELPVPHPAAGELLLAVGTAGVCGSDVAEWAYGPHQHAFDAPHPATGWIGPITPGHEFSGTVVAVGEGVDAETWLGTTVASCGSVACGACDPCLRGQSNQCAHYNGVGLHRPGALAEFVTTPIENCLRVNELGLSLDEAALCQPMSIAVHTTSRAGGVDGQTVVVQGVGGIGAFLVYALVESGADVVATDRDAERLQIARELGARATVHVSGSADDLVMIREAVGENELRVIFEVSGSRPGIESALALAPRGCRIVLVGIQKAPVSIDLASITLEERQLIGTNALVREIDFPRAVELIARRRGRWAVLAPRVLPLDQVVEGALRPMSEGRAPAIKTLIDPRGTDVRPIASLA